MKKLTYIQGGIHDFIRLGEISICKEEKSNEFMSSANGHYLAGGFRGNAGNKDSYDPVITLI